MHLDILKYLILITLFMRITLMRYVKDKFVCHNIMHIEVGEDGKNEIVHLVEGPFGEGEVAAHFKIVQNVHCLFSFF